MKVLERIIVLSACAFVMTLFGIAIVSDDVGAQGTSHDISILELNEQIRDKRSRVSSLRSQIDTYERAIRARLQEAASLQSDIANIEDGVRKTELSIEAAAEEIAQLGLEVEQATVQIQDKETDIALYKEHLAAFVRQIHKQERRDYLELFLTNERFSDFFDTIQYLETVNGEVFQSLERLKVLKDQLLAQRNTLEQSKVRLQELRQSLEVSGDLLKEQKKAKEVLVLQSVLSKEKYEQLLIEARAEQVAADSEISELEKSIRQRLDLFDNKPVSLSWPVDPSRGITTYFRDPDYPFRHIFEHSAIDIRAYQGTPLKAAASGYVARAKDNGMGYSYIMIVHDQGLATVYGHVSRIIVPEDTYIKKGDIIGFSGGMPGTAGAGKLTTGPHLHFEVRLNGIPVDPLKYLP
ncbi:peptidoglycan DD-metalloendopeptidase family protein [Candidatus Uhrbacteria bacterium]|nr:peptidoglycan DD-metalloendopeptidase family protein [Candidatus Uhrbacteria bacterium]